MVLVPAYVRMIQATEHLTLGQLGVQVTGIVSIDLDLLHHEDFASLHVDDLIHSPERALAQLLLYLIILKLSLLLLPAQSRAHGAVLGRRHFGYGRGRFVKVVMLSVQVRLIEKTFDDVVAVWRRAVVVSLLDVYV